VRHPDRAGAEHSTGGARFGACVPSIGRLDLGSMDLGSMDLAASRAR
jgi:hypothetical protein